ncbi:leucyl aminopeptidase [Euzebya sp.]|uniref:leucyl aminopeptidase n=1 Tax=Euzebya sp. TaxID=1971409 RepID=UPI003511A35E
MITIHAASADLADLDVDVVAVGVFKGGIEGPGTAQVLAALGLDDFPITPGFRGDVGQTLRLAAPGQPFGSVLLVGLGRMDGVSPASLRRAAGDVARAVPKARRIATTLAEVHPTRAAIEAVADGLALGSHVAQRFRSAPEEVGEREATLLLPSSPLGDAEEAIRRSRTTCAAVAFARDLVNTPPGQARPAEIAEAVTDHLPAEVRVTVHDEAWLAEHGCGGLLGVGRGSAAPPRLVERTYEPENPLAHVVLVGKGITFDTGGLNLKPGTSMMTMKCDMGGAAAVAGALAAIGELGCRAKVTGLLALAENAIGGDAQRPSDVLTTFDGTTVEVVNTDAEGRLVMADALGYGRSLGADVLVDVATLTGAAVVALGPWTAALMANDDGLARDVADAAADAGEDVWRLPLPVELDAWLESPVADIDNLGRDKGAGALLAGLFLQRFVGDVPWAHLDIAGPAFLGAQDVRGHQPEGGTGFGVTTLVSFLQRQSG